VELPIVKGLVEGDRRSLARAISIVDNQEPESRQIIKEIFGRTGKARTVGFTGPGGAILGDRVRMLANLDDERVFMRSMASRGAVGGVSRSLRNAIRVLDAAGYDLVLVESVGAGQLEIEITKVVDLTVVLFTPNTGDNVQAVKAGLTEVGDIYVVNKADIQGAGPLFNIIKEMIGETERKPAVLKVSAKTGKGIRELANNIDKLLKERSINYKDHERRMLEDELKDMVSDIVEHRVAAMLASENKKYSAIIDRLVRKETDPYVAAEQVAASLFK